MHVLSLSKRAPDDDRDVGVRNIESFVEDPCRYERAELAPAEAIENFLALLTADIARERHDEVLAGDRVGGLVVRREHEHLKEHYPWVKKAAILTDIKDAYSKSLGHDTFRPRLKQFEIEVVEEVDYLTGDTDFSAHITKIKAKKPDMIAVGGTCVETANMMKEAQKQDLRVLWVGGVGMGNARVVENAGPASEGAVHNATYDKDATTEMNQSYVKRLLAKVPNETPHWPAANCYDAMKMLAQAIKQANVGNTPKTLEADRKKVRDALASIKNSPALTSADGKVTIVDTLDAGDAIKKGTLIQVQNGKFVPVGEGKAAALKLR